MEALSLNNSKDIVCRTCLKSNRKYFNIFTHIENEQSIINMLLDCTTIRVEVDDGLPGIICNTCLRKLSSANDFRAMAIDCDFRLHNLLVSSEEVGSIKVKKEHITLHNTKNEVVMSEKLLNDLIKPDSFGECIKGDIGSSPISKSIKQDSEAVTPSNDRKYDANETCGDKAALELIKSEPLSEITPLSESEEPDFDGNVTEEEEDFGKDVKNYEKRKTGLSKKEQDQKTLLCKYCNKLFSFRYYFDIHVHQHTGNTPYKCELCDKRFVKRSMLNKHKQLHSDTKPYQCSVCGKRFKYLSNVHNHMVIHSEQKPYKCNICNKGFKVPGGLKIHIRRHTGERPYICEICGKSFISQGDLALHIGTHNTTKNFTCPKCGKSFANKMSLRVHLKRHSNNKPYACDRCNKSFSTNAILQHHILIHTGEKPYSCSVCGKSFRQSACIPRHMRIHTGETPYPCEKCPSKFKYKHHLLNHMKTHT